MLIKSLSTDSVNVAGRKITDVSLLGYGGKLEWSQNAQGLVVKLPAQAPGEHAFALRINGLLSV